MSAEPQLRVSTAIGSLSTIAPANRMTRPKRNVSRFHSPRTATSVPARPAPALELRDRTRPQLLDHLTAGPVEGIGIGDRLPAGDHAEMVPEAVGDRVA